PGARVEPESPAGILRIDAERHLALAAPVELAEGGPQQREGEPTIPPGSPHAHAADPPAAARNDSRETHAGDRATPLVLGEIPQVRMLSVALGHAQPAVEVIRRAAPQVGKRLLNGLERRALVLTRHEGADAQALNR